MERPTFSFEILPPLKGNNIAKVFNVVDKLREFGPRHISITSHHSEYIYKTMADGHIYKVSTVKRPGTVAVAAAIQHRYGIKAVPHIICKGFTKEETEYALLDLNFLGITDIFLLRGDSKNFDIPRDQRDQYHNYATDLQQQVNHFNEGRGLYDEPLEGIETPFSYGMACYPEKHEEAPNMTTDLRFLKMKADMGASYFVTQMFFDNQKYYDFVRMAREEGITQPIIPGIKPIVLKSQLTVLPRVFRTDLPEPLAEELYKCKTDADARQVGLEWCKMQCRDLIAHGVPGLHFYTLLASDSVREVAKEIY